ncbi:Protein kinase domain, partial [Dillenia turbinata]
AKFEIQKNLYSTVQAQNLATKKCCSKGKPGEILGLQFWYVPAPDKETMEHSLEKKYPVSAKDYKLYEDVGEGVSATVYRALCIPFNEIVAIKVLDLEKCNNDLDGIRREVHTMSLIDHPNVLRAHCSFTSDHSLWVVMPYMSGGSCLHIMKSAYPEGLEEPVIATFLCEVLKALVYLHAQGHIHRDVKAGNILIDSSGAVKLADLGVSACMFDTGDRQRSRNTFVGTPCWYIQDFDGNSTAEDPEANKMQMESHCDDGFLAGVTYGRAKSSKASHEASSNCSINPVCGGAASPASSSLTAAMDEIMRLIKYVAQISGNNGITSPEGGANELSQDSSTAKRGQKSQLTQLQHSVTSLSEELQRLKTKNAQTRSPHDLQVDGSERLHLMV